MGKTGKKKGLRRFFLVLLFIIVGIPLAWIGFSLIGRISPASLVPASYTFRLKIHNPMRLLDNLLKHENLPQLLHSTALAPALPLIRTMEENEFLKNPWVRFALRGSLDGALLPGAAPGGPAGGLAGGTVLAAWDAGFLSPLLRLIPYLSRFVTVPNLYYVQAGKYSRFEYRADGGAFYIGPLRNLLVISNDQKIFESLMDGGLSGGPGGNGGASSLDPGDYDAVLLFSPSFLTGLISAQDANIAAVLRNVEFPENVEAGISISPNKLDLQINAPARSGQEALAHLLERPSEIAGLTEMLPGATQYSTVLSAGSLRELYDAATVFSGPSLGENLKRADSSARIFLGLSLDDLLFSWTGREFAVFGMEGRPHPVYAIQVKDEQKRQEVFTKAFKSLVLNENTQLNLDGVRLPRIEIPGFLQDLLRHWNLRLPSPYYTLHGGYLLVSESAETLLAAVRSAQKNDVLPKNPAWRNLTEAQSGLSAFSLYYSLDRSLPFFLKGNTALSGILGLYRQGLLRLAFDRGLVRLSLSVIPGSGRGISLVSGYPLSPGGNPQNRVYGINTGKGGESRVFFSRSGAALSLNPLDNSLKELEAQGQIWVIPAGGLPVKSAADAAAWVVSAQGRVTLVSGDMEPVQPFPVSTGQRLSAPPAAEGGKVYLSGEDGRVLSVDSKGVVRPWAENFSAALRSPPSFLALKGAGKTYAAAYPKSFLGEIWLLDTEGAVFPGWPAYAPGIAFGSPLLFASEGRLLAAFITQAGDLSVFDENAQVLPPFPLSLDGVFYLQPVFDGEYLWLAAADGTLCQVSLGGEVLQQKIPDFAVREEGYITAFDVDGDAVPEIFISGEGNAFHGYTRNFRSLEGFPLPVWGRPLFMDLNGDGKIECTGIGMDRMLYRWQFK